MEQLFYYYIYIAIALVGLFNTVIAAEQSNGALCTTIDSINVCSPNTSCSSSSSDCIGECSTTTFSCVERFVTPTGHVICKQGGNKVSFLSVSDLSDFRNKLVAVDCSEFLYLDFIDILRRPKNTIYYVVLVGRIISGRYFLKVFTFDRVDNILVPSMYKEFPENLGRKINVKFINLALLPNFYIMANIEIETGRYKVVEYLASPHLAEMKLHEIDAIWSVPIHSYIYNDYFVYLSLWDGNEESHSAILKFIITNEMNLMPELTTAPGGISFYFPSPHQPSLPSFRFFGNVIEAVLITPSGKLYPFNLKPMWLASYSRVKNIYRSPFYDNESRTLFVFYKASPTEMQLVEFKFDLTSNSNFVFSAYSNRNILDVENSFIYWLPVTRRLVLIPKSSTDLTDIKIVRITTDFLEELHQSKSLIPLSTSFSQFDQLPRSYQDLYIRYGSFEAPGSYDNAKELFNAQFEKDPNFFLRLKAGVEYYAGLSPSQKMFFSVKFLGLTSKNTNNENFQVSFANMCVRIPNFLNYFDSILKKDFPRFCKTWQ